MKKITFITGIILGITLTAFFSFKMYKPEEDKKGLAKVMVIEGKYVFTNCEPYAPYETAFQFETKVHGFGGCPSVKDAAEACVKSALKKGFPFDGVILGNTKYDLAIKFK